MNKNEYEVLLYYKYVEIKDPNLIMEAQRKLCKSLNLKGRIILSSEGVNGTVEGKLKDTEKYIQEIGKIDIFKNIQFKRSTGTGQAFPKLSVKVRSEIVTSGVENLNPQVTTGKYISSEELHKWFNDKKEFYIVDMRNDYEYISGHFEGTIFSDFSNFRDLPKILEKLKDLKNKTIVTVCTGGVRCEKASGFLVTNGFNDVYQLKDGIQTYMQKYPNQHFKGKLYVFDNRLTVGFNTDDENHEVIGNCRHCLKKCDSYVNCSDNTCHRHYICCTDCLDKETGLAFCEKKCKKVYLKEKSKKTTPTQFVSI